MKRNYQLALLLMLTIWSFCFLPRAEALTQQPQQEQGSVDSVTAQVLAKDNLPATVQQRMEKSVAVIGEQLLLGKNINQVAEQQQHYGEIVRQVFDKVLVGYTVQKVAVLPGRETLLQVGLIPWQDRIQQVQVQLQIQGMPPVVEEALRQDVAGLEMVFANSLQGLPLAAVDWTNGLLKKQVNSFLQERAPEFKADFDIAVAESTQVQVTMYPLLPVVRTVDLNMRSDTLPNMGLLLKRQKLQQRTDELIGVPVPFVKRHQALLEAHLADVLNQDGLGKTLNVHTMVILTPGENLSVMSRSDSDLYRIRLEGWGDIWRQSDKDDSKRGDLMARLHFGRMMTGRDELFLQLDLYPQHMKWTWDAGYQYTLPSGTTANLRYDVREHYLKLGIRQPLAKKWYLRYEYRDLNHMNEWGLGYRLHDFLSLEYVVDRHDSWLRFIGYF